MVSMGWSFLPAGGSHSHAYRPIGLLLLLGDEDDDDADILKLQEGVLHPAKVANSDPQPCMVGHEGIQGVGVLPPSHGEDAEIDLPQPQIEGQNFDDGLLPPFRGEYAENNLLTPKIEGRKEKKGSVPVSKTVSDSGYAASADDEDDDGSIADADAETGYGPADDRLGTDPVAADAKAPDPAPKTGFKPVCDKGSVPVQKTAFDPEKTADGYDADPDEDAAAANAYASLADAEAHAADADEPDAGAHAAEDADSAEDDFAANAVDAKEDESDAFDQDDEEETASTDPDDGDIDSAEFDGDDANLHALQNWNSMQISMAMHMHAMIPMLNDDVFQPYDVCFMMLLYASPKPYPRVKKKTSLWLCITINMPFHPGEPEVSHETVAGHAPREGEDHVHADHVSQDDADSQAARVHDVCRFQDAAHPVVILADCSHDGMVLVTKAGTLSTYLPFPILRGSKGIYQDSEKQIEVPAKLVYAGFKKKTKIYMLLIIKAILDPG